MAKRETASFEALMQELEEISTKLSAGNLPLEEMVQLYEEGIALSKECCKILDSYDARIEVLRENGLEKEHAGE